MSLVLSRLQEAGRAVSVASAMGISEATVSRIKNDRLEETMLFLAHLGIKCVPAEFRCVDPERMAAFSVLFDAAMAQRRPSELVWGDDT